MNEKKGRNKELMMPIDTLTYEEMIVLKMADVEGKEQTKIANELGISQATVSRILASARKKVVMFVLMLYEEQKKEVEKMKIAFATEKGGLDDVISPIFARCRTFTIVDENGQVEVIENPGFNAPRAAAIAAIQTLIDKNVGIVVAGSFGPHAIPFLEDSGIMPYQLTGKTVREGVGIVKEKGSASPSPPSSPTSGSSQNPYLYPPWWGCGRRRGRGLGLGFGWRRRRWFRGWL